MLDQVVRELRAASGTIAKDSITNWMSSPDIEVLGAVYALISDEKHHQRIEPPLTYADYEAFLKMYLERCINENPDSQWADSRYSACWDAARWIKHFMDDQSLSEGSRQAWRTWLRDLHARSTGEVRIAIETGIVEHLPRGAAS